MLMEQFPTLDAAQCRALKARAKSCKMSERMIRADDLFPWYSRKRIKAIAEQLCYLDAGYELFGV